MRADPSDAPSLFAPTTGRVATALLVALGAFFLPQEAPLVWTEPSTRADDLLYLEIKVASEREGNLLVFYETAGRFAPFYSLQLPIARSEKAFTYTFPLPDVPISALRIHPPTGGGTLRLEMLRVHQRDGSVVRLLNLDRLAPLQQVQQINVVSGIAAISTIDGADDARLRLDLDQPLLASHALARNWRRAGQSVAYLTGVLWLGLMAVGLGVDPALRSRAQALRVAAFFALLALLFATVGHRGFLREAARVTMQQSRP